MRWWLGYGNTHGLRVHKGNDNAFFGMYNRNGEAGGSSDYNAAIYWGDDTGDDLVFSSAAGKVASVSGGGTFTANAIQVPTPTSVGRVTESLPLHVQGQSAHHMLK